MIAKSARHLDLHPAGGKLLAKPRDQHLDGGLVDRGADTVDMVDQLGFRDQPAIPLDKAFQRGEFLARKFKIDAVMRGETKGRIDGQPPETDLALGRLALAPQQCPHARVQLFHLERFDKIVIRPGKAAIDVFDEEPITSADDPLATHPRLVATPHIGFVTEDEFEIQFADIFDQVVAWRDGAPINMINPEAVAR